MAIFPISIRLLSLKNIPYLIYKFSGNLRSKTISFDLDLHVAYHQIPIASKDVSKTAVTPLLGLFKYTIMTFSLQTASQSFQHYIHRALGDLNFVFLFFSLLPLQTSRSIRNILKLFFCRLKDFALRIDVEKYQFVIDHKPLTCAFVQHSEKVSSIQQRQLSFAFQFTTCIENHPGPDNVVANSLSRNEPIQKNLQSYRPCYPQTLHLTGYASQYFYLVQDMPRMPAIKDFVS